MFAPANFRHEIFLMRPRGRHIATFLNARLANSNTPIIACLSGRPLPFGPIRMA